MTPLRLAIAILIMVAIACWQVTLIPQASGQITAVNSAFVPSVVVVLLALLTLIYGISAYKGREVDLATTDEIPKAGANRRLAVMLAGGLLSMGLISYFGFFIATSLAGLGVALGFDADIRKLKTWLIVPLTSLVFWLVFVKILHVNLGPLLIIGGFKL